MAELTKKLHFLKNGTEQTAKAYSTVDEAGSSYIPNKIDGVACYIPIGSTSDAMATNGRVIKGGTTYAIKSQSKPPYAEVKYTTAGTYTFTVPNNVTRLRVACVGGGAGGLATSDYGRSDDLVSQGAWGTYTTGSGGTSSFGSLIQATGGTGHYLRTWYTRRDDDGVIDQGYSTFTFGNAGTPNGNNGTSNRVVYPGTVPGGAGFTLSFEKATGSYGEGGAVSGYWSKFFRPTTGSSGGYNSGYVDVTPNTTYTVTVGAGGAGGTCISRYPYGNAGTSGFVLIAYGGDI